MKIQTPAWVKQAVFYQIFPDRFAKSNQRSLEPWLAKPTIGGYKGGDLWSAIGKLDYLVDLGINAIYLTPIFQSAANHRYHTHDYYQVDPMLGGNKAFHSFLKAAHDRNIKVILDGVFNHASRGFFFFNDILENGPHSPYIDWFTILDWPLSAYDGSKPANYRGWADNRALPQFNHDNPQVRAYLMEIGEYWCKQGIDGWRLDVAHEITTPGFWQEFRQRIKAINPDAYIVGEVWTDARKWLDGSQFDGVMNYLFAGPTIAFVGGDRVLREYVETIKYPAYPPISASEYRTKMEDLLALYPWEIQLTQFNLLNSHDTARLLTITGGDRTSMELATLLLCTFPGAPSIYYGDEVGLPGGLDPDCRRSFPPEAHWDISVLDYHKKLISLRHQYPALRTGAYQVLYGEETVYVFARILGSEEIIVAVNVGKNTAHVSVPANQLQSSPQRLLYGRGNISLLGEGESKRLTLNLPPRTGFIAVMVVIIVHLIQIANIYIV